MTTEATGLETLIRALNDRSRTRFGNPWRGTYAVSIKAVDPEEAKVFLDILAGLGIEAQLNSKNDRNWVTLYTLEAQSRLLEATGVDLDERQRLALDELVRARGPITEALVNAIRMKRDFNRMSFEAIAHLMNEKGIIDGMGGRGWTAKKVRAGYRGLPA